MVRDSANCNSISDVSDPVDFAKRYAEAWCSRNPVTVAAFFAENASLTVNGGPPTPAFEVARAFMRDFPDMTVTFDKLESRGDRIAFHWTLSGTHAETGSHVRISGYELWKIDNAGLIAESSGHFDAAEYERQLKGK
jgi:nuclear transport factor 2 (NTF2) superfamily protein